MALVRRTYPTDKELPVVLDMATSATSMGRVILAAKSGKCIPPRVAIDKKGEVTTDANEFEALLAFGGAKGSGLAIVIDVVCGILIDSLFGSSYKFWR